MNQDKNISSTEEYTDLAQILKLDKKKHIFELGLTTEKDNIENLSNIELLEDFLAKEKPDIFNLVELENYIKKGSVGFTYLAHIKGNPKQRVVMKFLKETPSALNEIKMHNNLRHKNIATCFGYFKIKDYLVDILEYGNYGDISSIKENYLKGKSLSETFLCYIAGEVLSGLYYLYLCNIVHLDIKPQNIVMNSYFNIKIIDFSISKDLSEIKETKPKLEIKGTNYYMSPEVLRKERIDKNNYHKIDLYALGVLIYKCAYGHYPYEQFSLENFNQEMVYPDLIFPKEVECQRSYSKLFQNLLEGLLVPNINKRPTIEEVINHPWIKEGYKIIIDEKEKIDEPHNFLTNIFTDKMVHFNQFLKKY